jgi:hypothetical protein
MDWIGEERNTYRIFMGKSERKYHQEGLGAVGRLILN